MQTPSSNENTYIFDSESAAEMARLINQDRFTTAGMGGPLVGLPELPQHARVLDLGCGPGGWVLDVAFARPDIEVAGVDISRIMVDYANARARTQKLLNVSFGVMDITETLDFSDATFDLINGRFLTGVLKRDAWLPFLEECKRIMRPGAILRLTEGNEFGLTMSSSLEQITTLMLQAMWKSGYGFSPNGRTWGMSPALPFLMRQVGYQDLQFLSHVGDHSANSPGWADSYHNFEIIFYQMKPMLLAHGLVTAEAYDQLCQQAFIDMHAVDFTCVAQAFTVWGALPVTKAD